MVDDLVSTLASIACEIVSRPTWERGANFLEHYGARDRLIDTGLLAASQKAKNGSLRIVESELPCAPDHAATSSRRNVWC